MRLAHRAIALEEAAVLDDEGLRVHVALQMAVRLQLDPLLGVDATLDPAADGSATDVQIRLHASATSDDELLGAGDGAFKFTVDDQRALDAHRAVDRHALADHAARLLLAKYGGHGWLRVMDGRGVGRSRGVSLTGL